MTLMYLNLMLESWGVLFCAVAAAVLAVGVRIEKHTRRHLLAMFVCLAAALCSNIVGLLTRGCAGVGGIVRAANFFEFFFSFLLSFLFARYILHTLGGKACRELRPWYIAFGGILALEEGMVALTQVNGFLYSVDAEAVYHRGRWYWLASAAALTSLLLDLAVVWLHQGRLRKKERAALLFYIGLMLLASAATALAYGVYWTLLASCAAAVVMLIFIISDQVDLYCEKEREVAEMQAAMMLSQIQPHFLYNVLTSIAQLCEKDPPAAKKATISFAGYLRENMNSLKQKEPVPFERELKHLQTYLELEKMRFGDLLHVELDIGTVDFSLPVLSVQMLAENAVKHGVGMKENGGTVRIETREAQGWVEITVSDDGVGFDPETRLADGGQHLGIDNVRRRLETMCHATLEIQSAPDKGTAAKIRLPREDTL